MLASMNCNFRLAFPSQDLALEKNANPRDLTRLCHGFYRQMLMRARSSSRPYLRKGGYGFKIPRKCRENFFAAVNLQRLNCDFASVVPCSACLLGLHFYNCHYSILCNTMILTF